MHQFGFFVKEINILHDSGIRYLRVLKIGIFKS